MPLDGVFLPGNICWPSCSTTCDGFFMIINVGIALMRIVWLRTNALVQSSVCVFSLSICCGPDVDVRKRKDGDKILFQMSWGVGQGVKNRMELQSCLTWSVTHIAVLLSSRSVANKRLFSCWGEHPEKVFAWPQNVGETAENF